MSHKQVPSKDIEEIERLRRLTREQSVQVRAAAEKHKQELQALRDESKGKLSQALKGKAPTKPLGPLSRNQVLALGGLATVLVLAGLNMASRGVPVSNDVLNGLLIRSINKQGRDYSVGPNKFFEGWSLDAVPSLFRVQNSGGLPTCPEVQVAALPARFNSRQRFAACVSPVEDQGNCTSSYALAVAGMMKDRYCIASAGKRKFDASAQHLLTCLSSAGCAGGDLAHSAKQSAAAGLVNTICSPNNTEKVEACNEEKLKSCPRLKFAAVCSPGSVEQIKKQIFRHGPVVSLVKPSVEFLVYKAGDYHAAKSRPIQGAQAVKVVGWDTDKAGRQVWLVENSWGASWGLKGLARVRFGSEPLLEQNVVAGIVENGLKSSI
jgi:cathepsin B